MLLYHMTDGGLGHVISPEPYPSHDVILPLPLDELGQQVDSSTVDQQACWGMRLDSTQPTHCSLAYQQSMIIV
jgi:hypothetical protein